MKRKILKLVSRLAQKLLLLALITGMLVVGSTNAYLSDMETSLNNSFTASTLDFSLSPTLLFSVTDLKPGNTHSKTMSVQKDGIEDFTYKMWEVKIAGDSALCDALQIDAQLGGVSQYNGSLSAFSQNPASTISAGVEDWTFIIRLDDTNYSLQSLSCSFDIHVKGWQVGSDGSWGLTDEESVSSSVATGRWQVPQVPTLISPLNNSYVNTAGLVMDWNDVPVVDGPLTYTYQSAYDAGFSTIAYTSSPLTDSNIPSPGNPEVSYWWHVQACNTNGCSAWSDTWKVTIDNTKPESIITTGLNPNHDNEAIKHLHVHWTSSFDWDGMITGTASDNNNVTRVKISVHRPLLNKYWDGDSWENGTEADTRFLANGNTTWSYDLPNHPTGQYVIKSHAEDSAGNIENTYTLYLEFIDVPPNASISLADDAKNVSFKAENLSGYKTLSYELSYETYGAVKGIVSSDIDISDKIVFEKNGMDLATCSGEVCTYDSGVHNFVLHITLKKADGTTKELTVTK